MKTTLESLLAELKGISGKQVAFAEPEEESGSRDHIVGILDEDLRKLFFLIRQYRRRAYEILCTLEGMPNSEKRSKDFNECLRFETEANSRREIFWALLRGTFPDLWLKNEIGIRAGWKVVWSNPEPEECVAGFFLFAEEEFYRSNLGDVSMN